MDYIMAKKHKNPNDFFVENNANSPIFTIFILLTTPANFLLWLTVGVKGFSVLHPSLKGSPPLPPHVHLFSYSQTKHCRTLDARESP